MPLVPPTAGCRAPKAAVHLLWLPLFLCWLVHDTWPGGGACDGDGQPRVGRYPRSGSVHRPSSPGTEEQAVSLQVVQLLAGALARGLQAEQVFNQSAVEQSACTQCLHPARSRGSARGCRRCWMRARGWWARRTWTSWCAASQRCSWAAPACTHRIQNGVCACRVHAVKEAVMVEYCVLVRAEPAFERVAQTVA
jgi:hypothetical protein